MLTDGLENGDLPLFQFGMVGELVLDLADLNLVQFMGQFFAITGDKGDCGPFLEKPYGIGHLNGGKPCFFNENAENARELLVCQCHCVPFW